MKIPDEVRKVVGFIAFENKINNDIIPVGSFFYLGHDPNPGEAVSRCTPLRRFMLLTD